MSVSPPYPPLAAVAAQSPDADVDEDESGDAMTKCGRCRLNFVRHPSVGPDDSSKWWLCPPCRSRLLGDETKTSSRWSS